MKIKEIFTKLFAPFQILKIESIYLVWFISFFISFSSIILDIINGKVGEDYKNGIFFGTCIAVIAPYFVSFIIDFISSNKKNEKENFSTYKGWTFGISLAVIVILVVLYLSDCKDSIGLQWGSTGIVAFISFYSYLVSKMKEHPIIMDPYKDVSYAESEKKQVEDMKKKAKHTTTISNDDGGDIKL